MKVDEVEVKSVVDDVPAVRARLEQGGAHLVFEGRLEDRRYDTIDRTMADRDFVLRLRVYHDRGTSSVKGQLDWKGSTRYEHGYKIREELSTTVTDPETMAAILARMDLVITREIDREIVQYELNGAMIRFEQYPRMDTLVEVEGTPETIERAIAATALSRAGFTTERLMDFVGRYEARTGLRAALCARELEGDFRFRLVDA